MGEVPCPAIGIRLRIRRLGDRAVDLPALGRRRRPVHRRPHQRVTEAHPRTELDEAGRLGRRRGLDAHAESLGGAPQQGQIAERLRGCREQQPPRLGRQKLELPQEALLDATRERIAVEDPEPARQLSRGHPTRKFEQRERVAAGFGDDPLNDLLVEATGDRGLQQPPRVVVGDPLDDQLRQPAQLRVVARLAHCKEQPQGLGQQAPRRERQGLCGSAIEPLRVIDQADQRTLLRDVRQQSQRRQRDEETVGRRARALPEHRGERLALRTG
jgi:hypothetical protein